MGFLDQKERILDVVLTHKGKELLSKNLLEFSFYAFSDESVNYSGSLSSSIATFVAFDDYVHRGVSFEADQRVSDNRAISKTLETFLFTIPSRGKVIPEFKTSIDDSGDVILKRSYFPNRLSFRAKFPKRLRKPLAIILRASIEKQSLEERFSNYGLDQQVEITKRRHEKKKNIIGMPLAKDYIALKNSALNIKTGLTTSIEKAFKIHENNAIEREGKIVSLPKKVEIVTGLDSVEIDLKLKSSEGEFDSTDGFLIEVFESGSDGKLKRLYEKTIEDPLSDSRLQNGFDSFLKVETK